MTREHGRVAVIGTGAAGAMALWQLASRGVEAVGFDRYAPGHDRGGVGGETRIFRTAYREGAEYVPLLQRSCQLWRELESDTGDTLLTMCGGLTIGPPEHPDVRTVLSCAQQFGLPHEQFTATEARQRFPEHPVREGEIAVLDHSAGVLRPEPAILAAAHRAEQLGAIINRYRRIHDVTTYDDRVVVHSDRGDETFDHVVLAPGPWSREQRLLDFVSLEVHQINTLWFPAKDPKRFSLENTPVVIRCGERAYSCFPAVDGVSVKVSIHHLERPRVDTAEELSRNPSSELMRTARETVSTLLPGLHADPIRTGTYADCFSPDGHALVGALPNSPNVTVLTGFSGHGFKLSPIIGEIAADLVLTGTTKYQITHLDPSRFC
jgi:sarcosine oxidase